MKHSLIKTSHTIHTMDGKDYDSISYLKHDFMHFAYMKVVKSKEGFFGEQTNPIREESIVGVLQGGTATIRDQGSVDYANVIEAIDMMLEIGNHKKSDLTTGDIENIYTEYFSFLNHWKYIKTGERFELEIEVYKVYKMPRFQ